MEKTKSTKKNTSKAAKSDMISATPIGTINKDFEWSTLTQVIGSVTGLVGIAAAILYILGNSYYQGKLDSLNITSLIIAGMPIENYLLGGYPSFLILLLVAMWAIFIYFPIKLMTQTLKLKLIQMNKTRAEWIRLAIVAIGLGGGLLLIFWGLSLGRIFLVLCELIGAPMVIMGWLMLSVSVTESTNVKFMYFAIACFLLLITQLKISYQMGYSDGCTIALEKSTKMTLFSDVQLSPVYQTKIDSSYQLENFYLLFSDQDNYYLYKDIDPETLKPKTVLSVRKTLIKSSDITIAQTKKSTKDLLVT